MAGHHPKTSFSRLVVSSRSREELEPLWSTSVPVWIPSHVQVCKTTEHLIVGMGIVENSTVRFGSVLGFASMVRFYHSFLNGLLMTFLGYETTQWNAWLNLPELESSGKFLYTSSLATFSTLRRLLSIVKLGRVPDLRDFEMADQTLSNVNYSFIIKIDTCRNGS